MSLEVARLKDDSALADAKIKRLEQERSKWSSDAGDSERLSSRLREYEISHARMVHEFDVQRTVAENLRYIYGVVCYVRVSLRFVPMYTACSMCVRTHMVCTYVYVCTYCMMNGVCVPIV